MTDDTRFRLVGDHVESLASGQMLAPGEYTTSAALAPEDKWLINEGHLIEAREPTAAERRQAEHDALVARAKTLDIAGRTKMGDAELRKAIDEAEQAGGEG